MGQQLIRVRFEVHNGNHASFCVPPFCQRNRPAEAEECDDLHSWAHVLSHLGCLMQQRPAVCLLHPSFADFLFTRSRCDRAHWLFYQPSLHHYIAVRCINHLNDELKENIWNMIISPDAVNMTLPEDLEYACLYWIEHNCRVKGADSGILQSLEIFLFKHLWHWLEAMSILRATREVIGLLRKLASCLRSWLLQRVLIHSHGTGALIYLTRGVI